MHCVSTAKKVRGRRSCLWATFLIVAAIYPGCGHPRQLPTKPSHYLNNSGADTVVVFVHGVFGDADSTWSNGDVSFPKLVQSDPELRDLDVYVHEYSSPHFS